MKYLFPFHVLWVAVTLSLVIAVISAVVVSNRYAEAKTPHLQQQREIKKEAHSSFAGKGEATGQTSELENRGFPKTAFEYAQMVEPELGVPPHINLDEAVEIPLYVNGKQKYGYGLEWDNPNFLGKDTFSGSTLQRYEGRTAEGKPLPDVVWVSFGRNYSPSPERVGGSVQFIGYNKRTGATAFFESSDHISPWVSVDEETLRMRGTMPWIDNPKEFNRAFLPPGTTQCVQCHQADPFITNDFITAAKIPGTDEPVIPILDADSPYYVIGGENWDMRTIHIEGNSCFECHRVGMSTLTMFTENGWKLNEHMPPHDPGSLKEDFRELMEAWKKGPEQVENAEWLIPPARAQQAKVVGDDYPNKASFNRGDYSFYGSMGMAKSFGMSGGEKSATGKKKTGKKLSAEELQEVELLLKQVPDEGIRKAFRDWIGKSGADQSVLDKLRSMTEGPSKKDK